MIPDWAEERRRMVESQIRRRGIHHPRVLRAMMEIPREQFIPPEERFFAYRDDPIPIGFGQTVSQPYMTALMAEALALEGPENLLEVGSGCGYAAAVLGTLAARVVTIEIVPGLYEMTRENLHRTGRDGNVLAVCGDGSTGYPPLAPYDAISVAAGAPEIPASLIRQLADPGRLVIPVGERDDQELVVLEKRDGRISRRVATFCRFVPLVGGEGWR